MKELVDVYRYIEYSKLTPPRKPEEFADYIDTMPNAFQHIQKGEFVVAWGLGRSVAPGAGNQVLAYEKKATTEGGAVLLRNGTVKQMTAADFSAAPKAK